MEPSRVNRHSAVLALVFLACAGAPPVVGAPSPRGTEAATGWLREQRALCSQVVGRVVDWRTGDPLVNALVSIDGTTVLTSTDSLGRFHVVRSPQHPQPAMLRVRRIGLPSTVIELRRDLDKAYVVEVTLGGDGMHQDGLAAVAVREAWTCEAAT